MVAPLGGRRLCGGGSAGGGAACGFYKIGGDSGGFSPIADSEVLPGFDEFMLGYTDRSAALPTAASCITEWVA